MADNPSNIVPDNLIVIEGGKQLVPAPSVGDSGKVLGVLNSNGDIGWTEDRGGMAQQQADWAEEDSSKVTFIANKPSGQMAPASTSSDSGKALIVNSNGKPGWDSIPTPTVDQTYNASSTNAQSGTAVAGALANIKQVPASTSADEDKVLTVNSSGNPEWATAQGGGGSAVYGKRVVDADPTYTEVSPLSPIISSRHIYYTLADDTETRQIAAVLIPNFTWLIDNWSDIAKIQNKDNGSPASNAITISIGKYNSSTNTYTSVGSVSGYLGVSIQGNGYFIIKTTDVLYIPDSPLPVLSSGETYVISMYSTVGGYNSEALYPSSLSANEKVQVYFSSTSSKVCFNRTPIGNVIAPLFKSGDSMIYFKPDYSKGFYVSNESGSYGSLSVRTSDVGNSLGYDPSNPEGYLQYNSLKVVENYNSDWSDKEPRFPGHRAYLESSDPMIANPSSCSISSYWTLSHGNRGNVYIVHFEIPMTSSGNTDVNCICKFYLQDREEDWETMQQTTHYHYYTLIGQYIASEQMAVFDGAITIPETKGMPDNQYWRPTVTPLESGTTLTVDHNRSPKYCWSFI